MKKLKTSDVKDIIKETIVEFLLERFPQIKKEQDYVQERIFDLAGEIAYYMTVNNPAFQPSSLSAQKKEGN